MHMTPRTGRPPSDNPRTLARPVRLAPDEEAVLQEAADAAGMKLGTWMRDRLLGVAKRELRAARRPTKGN